MKIGTKRDKIFGMPNSYPLNQPKMFAKLSDFCRRYNKRYKQPNQHIGPITRACFDVMYGVLSFGNRKTGSCFPSYEAIAERANCAPSTVGRALKVLEEAGVLTWAHRLVRVRNRVLRTSNGYIFRDVGFDTDCRSVTPLYKDSENPIAPPPLAVTNEELNSPLMRALARLGAVIEAKES